MSGLYTGPGEDSFKSEKQIQYEHIGEPTLIRYKTEQRVPTFEECKEQLFVSSGPYKYSDDYAKKKGFSKQRDARRGAVFMTLRPFVKQMDAYNTTEAAQNAAL